MKISYKNDNNHIFIEISTQELEESGIDIHSLLSICEYPTEKNLNDTLKLRSNINLSNFFVSSVFFINNIWKINLELKKANLKSKKVIKKKATLNKRIYKNRRAIKERKDFKSFYDYINNSIYSKYITIKNGIIFIKDKSKEKYILNFLSEYE